MKRLCCFLLLLAVVLFCTGCKPLTQQTLFAMDTVMDLQVWGQDSQKAVQAVTYLIQDLEEIWSNQKESSVISALNAGTARLTAEQQAVLDKASALSQRTHGAFDPRLHGAISLWGFLSDAYHVPSPAELETALNTKLWNLGAAIKGYAGQQAVERLKSMDVDRALLNLGGNVQTYGEKPDGSPWQIGIQNPDGGDMIGVVAVTGTASVVTSGDYQRYFEENGTRYHHILDPKTGYPADSGVRSVTVICRDGMTADALSTALFVMGLEDGIALWQQSSDFEAVFILSDGTVHATAGVQLSGCEYEVIHREN